MADDIEGTVHFDAFINGIMVVLNANRRHEVASRMKARLIRPFVVDDAMVRVSMVPNEAISPFIASRPCP